MHKDVDGDWLIDQLASKPTARTLVKQLKRLRSLFSIRQDLDQAQLALRQILAMQPKDKRTVEISSEQGAISRSLAVFAIITYARATDTSSNHRDGFDPRRYFNDSHKTWHKELITLRNDAIAHFGPGQHGNGLWAHDTLTIRLSWEPILLNFNSEHRRANYDSVIVVKLFRLIEISISGLIKDTESLQRKIIAKLEDHADDVIQLLLAAPSIERLSFKNKQLWEPAQNVFMHEDFDGSEVLTWS